MMRYEKKVAILAAALAALVLVWAAGMVFSPERLAARSEAASLLHGKIENATYLEIKAAEKLAFEKQGDSWFMLDSPRPEGQGSGGTASSAKFPAQGSRIKSLLDAVASVKRLRLLAKSKDAWGGFELDESRAKRLVARDARGGAIIDLSMGGYGPTGSEVYVRREGSDDSYAAPADFASYLGYGRKSWLDLKILPAMPDGDVQAFSLKSSILLDAKDKSAVKLDYSMKREGQKWIGSGGAAGQNPDSTAVQSMIRSILALEGEDYIASPPPNAFSPVALRIELTLGSGASKVMETGASSGDGRFYLRVAGGLYTFQVSSYSLRNLLKSPADLAQRK